MAVLVLDKKLDQYALLRENFGWDLAFYPGPVSQPGGDGSPLELKLNS